MFANAGMDAGGFLHELPFETWKQVLDSNLNGVYLTCKHALQHLIRSGDGRLHRLHVVTRGVGGLRGGRGGGL